MPPKSSSSSQKVKEKVETSQKVDIVYQCPQCNEEVAGDDQAMQCDYCEKWFHIICQDVTEEEYNFFNEYKRNHWFCKVCGKNIMSIIKTVNSLKERQDKVEEEFGKMKKSISKLEADNESIKLANSKMDKNLEEIMDGKLPDALIARIGKEIEKVTKTVATDLFSVKEDMKNLTQTLNTNCQHY